MFDENEQKTSEEPSTPEKIKHQLAQIESALYVAGRPLDLKTLAGRSRDTLEKKVRKLAKKLVENYTNRDTAIEILEVEGERFVMQLKNRVHRQS